MLLEDLLVTVFLEQHKETCYLSGTPVGFPPTLSLEACSCRSCTPIVPPQEKRGGDDSAHGSNGSGHQIHPDLRHDDVRVVAVGCLAGRAPSQPHRLRVYGSVREWSIGYLLSLPTSALFIRNDRPFYPAFHFHAHNRKRHIFPGGHKGPLA